METPEEKAISMFNSALKGLIHTDKEMNKLEAKQICLYQILRIKEALNLIVVLDKIPFTNIRKTLQYYVDTQRNIELL